MINIKKTKIREFYLKFLPEAQIDDNYIKAPCPFCQKENVKESGTLIIINAPESYFFGYFRCSNNCIHGGFPIYFGKIMHINQNEIPGYDPDREPYLKDIKYPVTSLDKEVENDFHLMDSDTYKYYNNMAISDEVVNLMKIGFNGRYYVYPYFNMTGKCYSARCILHGKSGENFWKGDKQYLAEYTGIFNEEEINRCENGALFITDSEDQLLIIKELGFPGIAVSESKDIEKISHKQLEYINDVFIVTSNTPEAILASKTLAIALGFKTRIFRWETEYERGFDLCQLAIDNKDDISKITPILFSSLKAFSPFPSANKVYTNFIETLENEIGKEYLGLKTGLVKFDAAHNGISGINIMGGQPKAGKSNFFMQISTEIARRKTPVIYYDFENGWKKIYSRTLCRLSKVALKDIMQNTLDTEGALRLENAKKELKDIFRYFKVMNDRKLTPDIMRKHIDFLQHETQNENVLIVVDSLHKLPFKDASEQRSGIDLWLRQMESIRDNQNVSFLVISELSRGEGGNYKDTPDMGLFKVSGDIEYSADNAMIFVPDWSAVDDITKQERKSTLWMVASRENNPGKIATYQLEYPFWGFKEL